VVVITKEESILAVEGRRDEYVRYDSQRLNYTATSAHASVQTGRIEGEGGGRGISSCD
jgi:hypothetical protein